VSGGDLLFYLCALVALTGALSSALRHDLRRAARSLLAAAAAVTALLALLGAPLVAALLGAVVVAAFVVLQRKGVSISIPGPGPDMEGVAGSQDEASAPTGRVRAALLVLAFLVIASRVVLMARWPLLAVPAAPRAVTWLPAVSLPHYLVTALVLFGIGVFAAITRRTAAGVGMGIALMHAAVAVGIAAEAHFVGGGSEVQLLVALVVAFAAASAMAAASLGSRSGDFAHDSDAAKRIATGISTVMVGLTLALLAGAW